MNKTKFQSIFFHYFFFFYYAFNILIDRDKEYYFVELTSVYFDTTKFKRMEIRCKT